MIHKIIIYHGYQFVYKKIEDREKLDLSPTKEMSKHLIELKRTMSINLADKESELLNYLKLQIEEFLNEINLFTKNTWIFDIQQIGKPLKPKLYKEKIVNQCSKVTNNETS